MVRRALTTVALCGAMALGGPAIARAQAATPTVAPASPVCKVRTQPPVAGLTLLSTAQVPGHPRVSDLTFASSALNAQVHADVLLPPGYDPTASTRYPVLYLLHGHGGNHTDWVTNGMEKAVGNLPVIVVMPDGGFDGWYSDWYGSDIDGHVPNPPPAWETFHISELLPWIDANFPTIADRRGRAIAGLSMGGFGAMSYAARHPDLFAAAGSFSGAVDMDLAYPVAGGVVGVGANFQNGKAPDDCVWGDILTQDVRWRDHDPTELVNSLNGLSLFIACGNGFPGRFDDPTRYNFGAALIEGGALYMNQGFDQALTAAHVAHTTDFYGGGTHTWPYWIDDLAKFAPQMTAAFAAAPAVPPAVPFAYESAASRFSVWGWTFAPQRDVTEMTYLSGVGAAGLDASGSGTLWVTTAPLYRPGASYVVTGAGPGSMNAPADQQGRLHFVVDLGPSHEVQQYAFGPQAESTFAHAHVSINPA